MTRRDQVVARSVLLIRTAEILDVPIVATRQHPRGLGEFDAPISEALERARLAGTSVTTVDKFAFDCFAEKAFCDAVVATGMRQLILVGMETHICIAQSALSGLREGFDVHVAADGCCSRLAEHHDLALARLGNAGAVVTTSESVAYELVERAGTEEFKRLLVAVKAVEPGSG
jgi:nicotinamidase-related amidase